ncbi:unnamed protein product, partial [Meganyctiphanes norvegica]
FHSSIQNTPFYLMFLRDCHVPYDVLLPPSPHEDPTLACRAAEGARCLELARKAISETQEKHMKAANSKAAIIVDIGDIVFCRRIHINQRDHKILPKFHGPFRVLDLKGNTAIVKSFRSGRVKQVSLRNVRLLPSAALCLSHNQNHGQVFPVHDSATEVPDEAQAVDVRRASDIVDSPATEVGLPVELPEEVKAQMLKGAPVRGSRDKIEGPVTRSQAAFHRDMVPRESTEVGSVDIPTCPVGLYPASMAGSQVPRVGPCNSEGTVSSHTRAARRAHNKYEE